MTIGPAFSASGQRRNLRFRSVLESLKFRIAACSMLFIALSVGISSLMVLRQVGERGERGVLALERNNAERLASMLNHRIVSLQLALRASAGGMRKTPLTDPQTVQADLASRPVLLSLFSSVFVATADGRIVAMIDSQGAARRDAALGERPHFKRTVALNRPLVSEPIAGQAPGETIIQLTMPISGVNGEVAGVVVGNLRLASRTFLDDLTLTSESSEDPVVTIVTDALGQIISHPQPERILKTIESEPGLESVASLWTAQGRPIEPNGDAVHAAGHFVAMAGATGADWMVFRVAADQTLLGGLSEARRQVVWIAAGVALLGGVLLLGLLSWLLWPLRRLQQRAQTLLYGDVPIDQGWPSSGGEIGQLSTVLQHVMRERAQSESFNLALMQKMQSVLSAAPIGIAFTRAQHFELVGREFSLLLGDPASGLMGRPAREIFASNEAYNQLGPRVAAAFADGRPFFDELQFLRSDGRVFWGCLQGNPVEAGNAAAGTIWLLEDITEERATRERLAWSANHDTLTNLLNRHAFDACLRDVLEQQPRPAPTSVLFIDLDRFKHINDSAGHAAGDRVLKDVAALLERQVRTSDKVARVGGDEFAVILFGCTREIALRVADQIRVGASQIGVQHQGRRIAIGASIGHVEIGPDMPDIASVMRLADAACYAAKHAGRNAVHSAHGSGRLRVVDGPG